MIYGSTEFNMQLLVKRFGNTYFVGYGYPSDPYWIWVYTFSNQGEGFMVMGKNVIGIIL